MQQGKTCPGCKDKYLTITTPDLTDTKTSKAMSIIWLIRLKLAQFAAMSSDLQERFPS